MNKFTQLLSLSAACAALSLMSPTVEAQDLDFDTEETQKKRTKKTKSVQFERDVREIERGFYSKANVGGTFYLLNHLSPITQPVNSLALSIGKDFIDRESLSMAWEVSFLQTVHNGIEYDDQTANGVQPRYLFQGDTRGFGLLASYEVSKYATRRFGIGLKLTGGIMGMPLLMDEEMFKNSVLSSWGFDPKSAFPNHRELYLPVGGGPTFEYYTKLAHFSVGADIDILYIYDWDLGIQPTGYMKYTF